MYLSEGTILPLLDFFSRRTILTLEGIGYLDVCIILTPVSGNKVTFKIADSSVANLITLAQKIHVHKIFQSRTEIQTVVRIGSEINGHVCQIIFLVPSD